MNDFMILFVSFNAQNVSPFHSFVLTVPYQIVCPRFVCLLL